MKKRMWLFKSLENSRSYILRAPKYATKMRELALLNKRVQKKYKFAKAIVISSLVKRKKDG